MAEKFPRSRFRRGYNVLPGSTMWLQTLRPRGDYNFLWIFHLAGVLSENLPAFSVFLQPFCHTCEIFKAENWLATFFLFVATESLYLWDKKFWLYVKDRFSTLAGKLSLKIQGVASSECKAEKPVRGLASKSDQDVHFLQRCCWWFVLLGHPRKL